MAEAEKRCIFDPMLVKPKCVWAVDHLKIVNKRLTNVNKLWKIEKKKFYRLSNAFWLYQHRFQFTVLSYTLLILYITLQTEKILTI